MVETEKEGGEDIRDADVRPIRRPSLLGRAAFLIVGLALLGGVGLAAYGVWRFAPTVTTPSGDVEAALEVADAARAALEERLSELEDTAANLRADAAAAEAERRGLASRLTAVEDIADRAASTPERRGATSAIREVGVSDALEERIAALERSLDRASLEDAVGPEGGVDRIGDLRADVFARLDGMEDALITLESALDAMELGTVADAGGDDDRRAPSAAVALLARDLARLESDFAVLSDAQIPRTRLFELEDRVGRLETGFAEAAARSASSSTLDDELDARRRDLDRRAATLSEALAQIKSAAELFRLADAVDAGIPYVDGLTTYQVTMGVDDPVASALRPFASTGAPSDEDLAARLEEMEISTDPTLQSRAADLASRLVDVRRSDEDGPEDDVVKRAARRVRDGDPAGALVLLEGLADDAAPDLSAWRADVAAVLRARRMANDLRGRARILIERASRGVE